MTTQSDSVKKVLVVDDSKVSRMMIRAHILEVCPHWCVVEAASGDEAVARVADEAPDYCTIDINMPGMLGTDAAAIILQAHPHIRVVIFSANIQEAVQVRVQQLGAAFVAKPVNEKSVAQMLCHFAG
jgi:two-component system, chemotaxis family, chemotaxis protein CheY